MWLCCLQLCRHLTLLTHNSGGFRTRFVSVIRRSLSLDVTKTSYISHHKQTGPTRRSLEKVLDKRRPLPLFRYPIIVPVLVWAREFVRIGHACAIICFHDSRSNADSDLILSNRVLWRFLIAFLPSQIYPTINFVSPRMIQWQSHLLQCGDLSLLPPNTDCFSNFILISLICRW